MKILFYSYFPPVGRHLAGGAQRLLDGLLRALHRTGAADITVLCPPLPGRALMADRAGLRIAAELTTVDGDPSPAGARHDLRLLDQYCGWADVIVTVDRHFPIRTDTPVVLCLNNFSYGPETCSVFALGWDAIVVPSDYLRRCLEWDFGTSAWQGAPRPIHVIPCGVDRPGATTPSGRTLRMELGLSDTERYIGFPHRPDPKKGFETAVDAVAELRRSGECFTLLVPTPKPAEVWPHQQTYIRHRRELVDRLGMNDAVRFCRWILADEMPALYGQIEWSLCLSLLPEGFGLSVLEGLAAGLPVISTPAGAIPEIVPVDHGAEFIDFGDAEMAARVIADDGAREAARRGRAYVASAFDWDEIAAEWIRVLASVEKSEASYEIGPPRDEGGNVPWRRRLSSGRVWDDQLMEYVG